MYFQIYSSLRYSIIFLALVFNDDGEFLRFNIELNASLANFFFPPFNKIKALAQELMIAKFYCFLMVLLFLREYQDLFDPLN